MRNRDNEQQRIFSRRAMLLGGVQVGLMSVLAGRLYYLQVLQSDRYRTLAEENRINMRLLPPSRGRIVDRFGVPLAINQQNYRVLIKSENTPDVQATLDRLAEVIRIRPEERERILRELKRKRKFVPVTVREYLDWDELSRVEVNAPDLPGINIDVGERRYYPYAGDTSHIIGYVGAPSEDDLTGDPLLELPGFRIGRNGVEKRFDLPLRGKAGASQLEVNAVGRIIRELGRTEGQSGQDVVLTLDVELQRFAMSRLGEEAGSVVVLDTETGAILVQASTPGYDPNAFTEGLSPVEWRAMADDERAPLRNKAIAGEYAPGSTFKMIVALAALEAGVVDAGSSFFCSGSMTLGDGKFHCWKRHGHGHMNLEEAIAQSCDIYFYEIAKRVGIDRIADMANRFGLGDRLGLDVPGERRGLVPTKAWKQAVIGNRWALGETLVAGIGQGFVLTTPLQLAVMTARIANGGRAVTPFIARDRLDDEIIIERETPEHESVGVSGHNLGLIRKAMNAVVNGERGTARGSRLDLPGVAMAGKTGTAQVRRISRREREDGVLKNEELPWRYRDHALFVAFAPVDKPRYAIAVVVEHGGGGSAVAAPIARDVMERTLQRDPASQAPGADVAELPSAGLRGG
ncbi:MAG: penicillin-binding protein 2 [Alphaproteobacteria bacterium]|jgi:penicillin-binding protein 2